MSYVNTKRLFKTFSELVAVDSPSLGERAFADELADKLRKIGVHAEEDGAGDIIGGTAGNLYALSEGELDAEPLLFCAHMDTVEPSKGKKAVKHLSGKITSDGDSVLGADDAAGIAAILEALTVIRERKMKRRTVELLFTVAEEIYGLGAAAFDYSNVRSKEAYIPDLSGGVGGAAYMAPTIIKFEAEFIGRAAHAGFAFEEGAHAIKAVCRAVDTMEMGKVDGSTTVNVGVIGGGTASNIVPDLCSLKGEIRSLSHDKAIERFEDIHAHFRRCAGDAGCEVKTSHKIMIRAYRVPPSHPVVERFKVACAQMGIAPNIAPTYGGSDNNVLMRKLITGLVIGSAMYNAHSVDEYTTLSELEKLTDLIILLMTS